MIQIRKSEARGHANHGWLDARHSFSFASYYDPQHMGFRDLRVINEDTIAPGGGFPAHPHRDMEIVTYLVRGELAHRDNLGNGETIGPGEIQRMSAGSGITHSEFNNSSTEDLKLLQIWIETEQEGIEPSYQQKVIPASNQDNKPLLVVSRDAREGSLEIHQDVDIYSLKLAEGFSLDWDIAPGRHHWIQVVSGELALNGEQLSAGDGVAISEEAKVTLDGTGDSETLIFDLK